MTPERPSDLREPRPGGDSALFVHVDTSKIYPALFLGCDPGTSGAVAAVGWRGESRGWITGESTDRDLLDWLLDVTTTGGARIHTFAVLEEVGAKPRITPGGERVSVQAGPGKDAWFYEARNGIDVVVEGDPSRGCAGTIMVRIPWASVASYTRRRLGREVL